MAISASTAETAAAAAVKAELIVKFPTATVSGLGDLADAIAKAASVAVQHVKDDADLTGVTSGGDTVAGGVD